MKPLRRFALFLLILLIGCHGSGSANQNAGLLSRVPPAVAAAFNSAHPGVTATAIHVRLFPDGATHYQVSYLSSGQTVTASYLPNGKVIP